MDLFDWQFDQPIYEIDAKKLAELHRADIVPESYVAPEKIRSLRASTRGREHLVDERTK